MRLPNEPNKDNNNSDRALLQLQQLLRRNLYVNFKLNSAFNRSTGGPSPPPSLPPLLHLLPSELKAPWKVKQIQTDTNKQTKLTETAKQTEIKLLLLLSSAPLLVLFLHLLLLLLLRFCLLIYFHSHLLQRQQNISSCKVSGEINSASGATHTQPVAVTSTPARPLTPAPSPPMFC